MITTYDNLIKEQADNYLPGVDWRLIKAQLWQESRLNPEAMSPAGAQGIAQFMPATWSDVAHKLQLSATASPFDPEYAIPACCFYMAELFDKWTAPRPEADRYALTLASYNAGFGNLLKAQQKANNANAYSAIAAQLDEITGRENARQTTDYVKLVLTYFVGQVVLGHIPYEFE